MSFGEQFKEAVRQFVERETDERVAEITGWDEDSYESGGCETCAWTTYEVQISYLTEGGRHRTYNYDGRFTALLYELTRD